MFGENATESPRMDSPWRALSPPSSSPSPLSLRTPTSTPSTPVNPRPACIGLDFEFEGLSLDSNAIEPEVDKSGHIEYKLKLPSPSPLRLAKLTTQLKWRLVEGGGMCLYELGVLDNGNIIGLVYEEMTESLQTLGRMLGGLGGGEININRVIRVGSSKRDDTTGSGSDSGGDSSEGGSISTSSSYPFHSYRVEDSSPELEIHNTLTPLRPRVPSPIPLAIPSISKQQLLREHHNRSAAEKAFDKDSKREKRRQFRRGGGEVDAVPFDYVQRAKEKAAYRLLNPKPIPIRQPPKVIKQPYVKPPQVASKFKPEMMLAEGQVRYVVEAQVTKRIQCVTGRDTQEDSLDDSDGVTDAPSGEEEQEEDEGWNFLEFDFMAAQKRGTDGSP